MTATAAQAIASAKATARYAPGMCLRFVRTRLGVPARYPSAAAAWRAARHKHAGDASPPAGVPVFWTGGAFGHVALSNGDGRVWSTDWPSRGRVGLVRISDLSRAWRKTYVGWTSDLNGVSPVPRPAPAPPAPPGSGPIVDLRHLRYGSTHPDVKALQHALIRHGQSIPAGATGFYGPQTDTAVRSDQVRRGFRADPRGKSFVGPRQAAGLGLRFR